MPTANKLTQAEALLNLESIIKVDGANPLTGSFPTLMTAVDVYINSQHDLGRFTGQEYGRMYVDLLSMALDRAIQFDMQTQEMEIKKEAADNANLIAIEQLKITKKELLLKGEEIDAAHNANLIAVEQLKIVKKDLLLKEQEKLEVEARIKLITEQAAGFDTKFQIDITRILMDVNLKRIALLYDADGDNSDAIKAIIHRSGMHELNVGEALQGAAKSAFTNTPASVNPIFHVDLPGTHQVGGVAVDNNIVKPANLA